MQSQLRHRRSLQILHHASVSALHYAAVFYRLCATLGTQNSSLVYCSVVYGATAILGVPNSSLLRLTAAVPNSRDTSVGVHQHILLHPPKQSADDAPCSKYKPVVALSRTGPEPVACHSFPTTHIHCEP